MDVLRCPRCWKPLPSSAAFCRRCGRAMQPFTHPQSAVFVPPIPPRAASAPRRSARPSRFPRMLVVAALVGLFGAFIRHGTFHRIRCCPVKTESVVTMWDVPAPHGTTGEAEEDLVTQAAGLQTAVTSPRIEWVSTGRLCPSVPLVLRGRGLEATKQVLFIGLRDGQRAEAVFAAKGDGLLYATVPDMGERYQDLAVVVVTPRGAAVAGGSVGDNRIRVIGDGQTGVAARGRTLFVRRGGVVLGRGNDDTCLIFREADVPATTRGGFRSETDVPSLDVRFLDTPLHYRGW
jgi:hypothetical protein